MPCTPTRTVPQPPLPVPFSIPPLPTPPAVTDPTLCCQLVTLPPVPPLPPFPPVPAKLIAAIATLHNALDTVQAYIDGLVPPCPKSPVVKF